MKEKLPIKVALIQMSVSPNLNTHLKKVIRQIEEAARAGAQIVCLEELFKTVYFPQKKDPKNFALAESIPGETTNQLALIAKKNRIVLIVPIFEKFKRKYFNSCVVIDADGKLLGTYRKMHIPDDPGFYEKYYFSPGDRGFKLFRTKYAKIGVLICWDQWFPEAARTLALQGADVLFYPTAIGWDVKRTDSDMEIERNAWETIQRSHAIANGVYVASVNRVGRENGLQFWGSSFVSGPFGEMIARGSRDKDEILYANCTFSRIQEMRKAWPFFRDLRINQYQKTISSS